MFVPVGVFLLRGKKMSVFLLKCFVNYLLKTSTRIRTSVMFSLICCDYTIRKSLAIYRRVLKNSLSFGTELIHML